MTGHVSSRQAAMAASSLCLLGPDGSELAVELNAISDRLSGKKQPALDVFLDRETILSSLRWHRSTPGALISLRISLRVRQT